jgi:hypothetical protein
MTYRGVYRDGVVYPDGDVDLRNGEYVEISRAPSAKKLPKKSRSTSERPVKTKKMSKRARVAKPPLPGFGAWKHRDDIVDSAEFARELRRRVSSREPRR